MQTNPQGGGVAVPIDVLTRWHQGAVIGGFLMASPVSLASIQLLPPDAATWHVIFLMALCALAAFLPAIVAFIAFPRRDKVRVLPDGLSFERHGTLRFADLCACDTQGDIKLGRVRGATLLLQAARHDPSGYSRFCLELVDTLEAWRRRAACPVPH